MHANAVQFMRMKKGIEEPFELHGSHTIIKAEARDENPRTDKQAIHIQREITVGHEILVNYNGNSQKDLVLPA